MLPLKLIPLGSRASNQVGVNFSHPVTLLSRGSIVSLNLPRYSTETRALQKPFISREGSQLLPNKERADFMSIFPQLIKDATNLPEHYDMPETNAWLAKVMDYNVPFGKRTRGMTTALAYRYLNPEPTQENIQLSYILGWCAEILQAYLIVMDDILDGSETRRGSKCWYRVDSLGVNKACNDALLLESTTYLLLKKYFRKEAYYTELIDVFRDVNHKTCYGQSLDSHTATGKKFETFTMDRFLQLAKYKTSFYTFYFPVRLAMAMDGTLKNNQDQNLQQLHAISITLGQFYQVQNDYTDCFTDSGMTGKIGTDIQDGNCTWLFVQANARCCSTQRKVLWENYGRSDPQKVETVKGLYTELGLPKLYQVYQEDTYHEICDQINRMSVGMPKQLFFDMLNYIYRIKV